MGCRLGNYAIYLAGVGSDVTGVDISPSAVALAEAKAQEKGVAASWSNARLKSCLCAGAEGNRIGLGSVRLILFAALLSLGGCRPGDTRICDESATPKPKPACWVHGGGPTFKYENWYLTYDKYPGYGMVFFPIDVRVAPENERQFVRTSLMQCRKLFMDAYHTGRLTYWHPTKHETPFPIRYVVVILQTPAKGTTVAAHDASHPVGYLFSAKAVFSEKVDYDSLIANAFVHRNPVYNAPLSEHEQRHGYSFADRERFVIVEEYQQTIKRTKEGAGASEAKRGRND